MVLYIVSMYSPVTYPAGEGTDHIVSGFGVFVSANRLEWVVGLCVLAMVAGAVMALWAFIRQKKAGANQ